MSVKATSEFLSPDDAKFLVGLCRAGKLYEIEKWIAAGKSIRAPPQIKKTPLKVAIDLGFHSLIELLVRNEGSQAAKDRALSDAVSRRRLDLVELLISCGAHPQGPLGVLGQVSGWHAGAAPRSRDLSSYGTIYS